MTPYLTPPVPEMSIRAGTSAEDGMVRLGGVEPPTLGLEVNIRAQRHPRIPSKARSIQAVAGDALGVRLGTIGSLPRTNPAQALATQGLMDLRAW